VEGDCWNPQLNKEDAIDSGKWRKLVKDIDNTHKDRE